MEVPLRVHHLSLRGRVSALLVVASVLPPLVVAAFLLQHERTTVHEANVALLQARVDEVGHTVEAIHHRYHDDVTRLARDPEISAFCAASESDRALGVLSIHHTLGILQGDDPAIRGVGVVDRSGSVVAATEPALLGHSVAYRQYFLRALGGSDPAPEIYVSVQATGNVPTIAYAAPVRARAGDVVGVFVLWLRGQALWDVMRAAHGMAGRGSSFTLFDRHGIRIGESARDELLFHPSAPVPDEVAREMLADRRFQRRTAELLAEVAPFPLAEMLEERGQAPRRVLQADGVWNVALWRHFPALGWTLVAEIPEREIDVRVASLLPRVLPATLVGLALALFGGAVLMRRVVGPIRALASAAAAVERGDYTCERRILGKGDAGHDELGQLAAAFCSMATSLADRDRTLRARHRDLKQVLDSVGQGFLAMDPQGVISQERSAIVDAWFGAVLPGDRIWSYLGREDAAFAEGFRAAWDALLDGSPPRAAALARMPPRLQRGDRTFDLAYRLVEAHGRIERVILVASDVTTALATERAERQMEAELRQAQKLEAVGRLAAGIAHEINTPIQFIGDNTRFVEQAFGDLSRVVRAQREALAVAAVPPEVEREVRQAVEDADLDYVVEQAPKAIARTLDGVERVATIVRAMKEFAHPDCKEMVATDLNRGLLATLEVARNEYKYVADVETSLGDIPSVTCHPGDLNQVFLNVVVNAAHAIEDAVKGTSSRGAIRVATRREGGDVVVAISDTGGGIREEIRDKLFDPFFTTKEVGRGTGQGLAIARNIVAKHGGQLSFSTKLGEGTTFFVRLPIDPPASPPAHERREGEPRAVGAIT
jgi:signal transduction histidine kinase/HAMP domain-containing protein